METTDSKSDSQRSREFYLPGASVRSNRPGAVERFVTPRLSDHSRLVSSSKPPHPIREFYLPGMVSLGSEAGRIERYVTKLLGNHDVRPEIPRTSFDSNEFYLPGVVRRPSRGR